MFAACGAVESGVARSCLWGQMLVRRRDWGQFLMRRGKWGLLLMRWEDLGCVLNAVGGLGHLLMRRGDFGFWQGMVESAVRAVSAYGGGVTVFCGGFSRGQLLKLGCGGTDSEVCVLGECGWEQFGVILELDCVWRERRCNAGRGAFCRFGLFRISRVCGGVWEGSAVRPLRWGQRRFGLGFRCLGFELGEWEACGRGG